MCIEERARQYAEELIAQIVERMPGPAAATEERILHAALRAALYAYVGAALLEPEEERVRRRELTRRAAEHLAARYESAAGRSVRWEEILFA